MAVQWQCTCVTLKVQDGAPCLKEPRGHIISKKQPEISIAWVCITYLRIGCIA